VDPQELIRIIQALDQLVETATKETVNNRDFDGQKLLDFVGEEWEDLMDVFPREDGLLVYGPYNLEELVGTGRNDLNLVIEPLTNEANEDLVSGFRLMIMDQSSQSVGGPNFMRPEIDEIFILDLGEFSTKQEMENLFTKTSDIDGTTASVSLVGDKLDEIFPNSTASIEMALTNQGPVISDRLRRDINRQFIPPYALEAFEKVDAEQAAQYSELTGDVEIPDTVEAAAADVVPDDISQINLEDDVAEVNNDFVYKKFAERQNTADNVIFKELPNGSVELLVIKRKRGPHRSLFALPGGIVEEQIPTEILIKGLVDPGGYMNYEPHNLFMAVNEDIVLSDPTLKRSNEIFGVEALREAVEEVDLKKRFIKNSFYLPVKLDRYDWDARAAQGVNVGGMGIIIKDATEADVVDGRPVTNVIESWVPKAKDDALSYEWIKLDDVIDGKKQLAFGHVEFVKDALAISLKNEMLSKSTKSKINKGTAIYDYDDITELDNRILESSKRNVEIIKASNEVRTKMGEPVIPIEGNNLVDRKNKAMIDSIRSLKTVTSNSKEAIKFTAQTQMKPDFIFIDLMGELVEDSLYMLDIDINDIVEKDNVLDTLKQKNGIMNNSPYSLTQDIKVTDTAKNKFKTNIKEYLKTTYRYKLLSKINQGMMIDSFIAGMANNADQIINSKDFDTILNALLDSGLSIEVDPTGNSVSALEWGETELADYIRLDERNTNIERIGIEDTVSENIEFAKNNFGDDIGQALNNIRDRNTKFFEKTFPPEIYTPSWDYYKDNAVSMPEAMLETQKLKLTADNRLQGMVYHGSPGLNARGREIMKIFNKILFNETGDTNFSTMKRVMKNVQRKQFHNSMEGLLNKISYEDNINWLDPTKYRGRQLRLNYMYSTSNPFVAGSYALGGLHSGTVKVMNVDANQAFNVMLNHVDVLDPEDVETFTKLKSELEKIGVTINEKTSVRPANLPDAGQLSLRMIDADLPMTLIDPAVMQIKFDVPANAILHTDMPLVRQLNNPNVPKLLNNIVNNIDPELIFDEETVDRLVYSIFDNARTNKEIDKKIFSTYDEQQQRKLFTLLEEALQPDTAARKTIRDYYISNIGNRQQFLKDDISQLIEKGVNTFSDLQGIVASRLYANEAISEQGLRDALIYINSFGGSLQSESFFVDNKYTAGHVLFTKQLNEAFPNQKKINLDDVFKFAQTVPLESLGGSYSATRDLYLVQKFADVIQQSNQAFDGKVALQDFYEYFKGVQGYNFFQKNAVQNAFEPTEDILYDLASIVEGYSDAQYLRVKQKFGIDIQKDFAEAIKNIDADVNDIVYANNASVNGDKTLVNFLNQINALPQKYVQAVGSPQAYADILLLKSLSQSGIEIVAGTGGGRVANDYHDVFGIVDPGDKFGTGVPRQAEFTAKGIELSEDALENIDQIVSGNKSFADLGDSEIKAIAEFIPIQTIHNNETLSQETKDRYAKLYDELNIYDDRFIGGIDPKPVDGVFLQQFDEFRNLIAQQSIFGDVEDEVVQNHVAKMMNTLQGQVDPQDVTKVMNSTGLTRALADGLDMFDAAVFGPVLIDLLMSRVSGVGSETATIGGAVADVAQDIYDPTETDTVFENLYGSPEDPGTLAGAVSGTMDITKEAYVNPLLDGAKNNRIVMSMFDSLKDTAVSALNTVKDGFGLNDWIYNVKRDMYVSSKLKEKGYTGDRNVPKGLVKILENEYESALPRTTDKYGQPLDVGDTTNFPSYNPGRR